MRKALPCPLAAVFCLVSLWARSSSAQSPRPGMTDYLRAEVHGMLRDGYEHIRTDYYDPTFHGVDLNARYAFYDAQLNKAETLGQGLALISAS